ncbi:MAG TPA: C1 family peptidase, partial [Candidatus Aminicenantes bacterium]|nr:C1 family peptidase [Candidatus Aminicenantes bacterium]
MNSHGWIRATAILGLLILAPQPQCARDERISSRPDDSLEEIQQKIDASGYGFTVGHNWVFDLPPAEKARFHSRHSLAKGVVEPFAPGIGPLAEVIGRQALPSHFDWRDVGGHSYIGAVRNQGNCGSNYAFAACAAAESVYNFAHGLTDGACADFSESYILWCLGCRSSYYEHFYGCDGADSSYSELQALVDVGVPNEAAYPYVVTDPQGCTHEADPRVRMAGWYRIPCGDVEAIKTAIVTYGAVVASVLTTDAFDAYSGGIYEDTNTACSGSPCEYTPTDHGMALVGWDDTEGVFYLRNCWGTGWGENGYMRIKYTSAAVACAVCYFVPETPAGSIELNRTTLNFGMVGASATTGSQTVVLSNGGSGTLDWTASASMPWITVIPTSGSGNAVLTVSVNASGRP